jgi:ATP-binding cassette subfamily B protein
VTSTLSGVVSNIVSLVLTLAAMLWLSWPVTVAALALIPLFLIPARPAAGYSGSPEKRCSSTPR